MKKIQLVCAMAVKDAVGEIDITGEVVESGYEWDDTETSASRFRDQMKTLGDVDEINVHINSQGGSVFDGIAIYQMLVQSKAKVTVFIDGLAASIASVIAMAGDEVIIPKNAMLMVHNPWTYTMGNAKELRKQADDLDKITASMKQSYLAKAGDKLSDEKLVELLDAETWLSADEAVEYGLADTIAPENRMAASIRIEEPGQFKNLPKNLMEQRKQPQEQPKEKSLLAKKLFILKGE